MWRCVRGAACKPACVPAAEGLVPCDPPCALQGALAKLRPCSWAPGEEMELGASTSAAVELPPPRPSTPPAAAGRQAAEPPAMAAGQAASRRGWWPPGAPPALALHIAAGIFVTIGHSILLARTYSGANATTALNVASLLIKLAWTLFAVLRPGPYWRHRWALPAHGEDASVAGARWDGCACQGAREACPARSLTAAFCPPRPLPRRAWMTPAARISIHALPPVRSLGVRGGCLWHVGGCWLLPGSCPHLSAPGFPAAPS